MTGVKVVDPCCEAAACNNVANCSGLYSLLGVLGVTEGSLVTADMLGKRADMLTGVAGELPEDWLRTSTILWVETAGMGWEMGSSPMRIRLAFSDSFSHALAKSCSA